MSLMDGSEIQMLASPAVSPDGSAIAVIVSRQDIEKNRVGRRLCVFDARSGGVGRDLTDETLDVSYLAWSPDGTRIAFTGTEPGSEAGQLYIVDASGGTLTRVTQLEPGAFAGQWLPDGRTLIFLSWTHLAPEQYFQAPIPLSTDPPLSTAMVWERGPVAFWDHYLPPRHLRLFAIDLKSGAVKKLMQDDAVAVEGRFLEPLVYAVSPDGAEIAFAGQSDMTGLQPRTDIYLVPASGGAAVNLSAGNLGWDYTPAYSPDGRYLAWLSGRNPSAFGRGGPDPERIALFRRDDGTQWLVSFDTGADPREFVWTGDSRSILCSAEDHPTRRIFRIDVADGRITALTGAGDHFAPSVGGGRVFALRSSFREPPTLVERAGATVKPLSHVNDEVLRDLVLGDYESVVYNGAGGDPVQMWVIKPPAFDPRKCYPLLLLLHGGPHFGVTDTWPARWNAQVFASWGYVVAWHNFHGSSGFGEAFADSLNGFDENETPGWLRLPYEDTIAATEWFARQPWIDADRMAALGGSFGGFLACVLEGKPHPFKAIVAHAPVFDQIAQIAADYAGKLQRFGHYWDNKRAWDEISAHTYAANFQTPMLVIHGLKDLRVPATQSLEVFHTLQECGVRSRLVIYPDEHHWILKPQNHRSWLAHVCAWVGHFAPPGADVFDTSQEPT